MILKMGFKKNSLTSTKNYQYLLLLKQLYEEHFHSQIKTLNTKISFLF